MKYLTKFNVFKFQSSGQKNLFVTVKQIRKFEGTTEDMTKYCPSFNSSKNELHDSLKAAMKFKYLGENSIWSTLFFFEDWVNPEIILDAHFERLHLKCLDFKNLLRYCSGIMCSLYI